MFACVCFPATVIQGEIVSSGKNLQSHRRCGFPIESQSARAAAGPFLGHVAKHRSLSWKFGRAASPHIANRFARVPRMPMNHLLKTVRNQGPSYGRLRLQRQSTRHAPRQLTLHRGTPPAGNRRYNTRSGHKLGNTRLVIIVVRHSRSRFPSA